MQSGRVPAYRTSNLGFELPIHETLTVPNGFAPSGRAKTRQKVRHEFAQYRRDHATLAQLQEMCCQSNGYVSFKPPQGDPRKSTGLYPPRGSKYNLFEC